MELYLGEYINLRSLGEGSFADVYLVRHHALGYIRALKVSKDNIKDESDKKWQKFMKECRLLLRIGNGGHPNIIKIYQPRLINNRAVVEMDYVEGDSLQSYIEQCQFLPFKEVWRFVKDIIGAMAYCHVDVYRYLMNPKEDGLSLDPTDGRKYIISKDKENELIEKYGVCHNDLHSKNIMHRDLDGSYILLDFGLAIQNRQAVNSSNKDKGAVEYSAPEKFDNLEPTIRSDVYSLGVLLFKVLTGVVPFPLKGNTEKSISDVWEAKRTQTPPKIFNLRKQAYERLHPDLNYTRDYPEAFDSIIQKCLAVKPENRYKNAKELLIALEDAYSKFDELSRLDNANAELSSQLSIAYSKIGESESSALKTKEQLEETNRLIKSTEERIRIQQDAWNKATKKIGKWKRIAILLPIIVAVLLGAIAAIAWYKTPNGITTNISQPNDTGTLVVKGDTVYRVVRDTIKVKETILKKDTIRIVEPKTVTKTETKIEYRTSPKVQEELETLRKDNKTLQKERNNLRKEKTNLQAQNNDLRGENKRLREALGIKQRSK